MIAPAIVLPPAPHSSPVATASESAARPHPHHPVATVSTTHRTRHHAVKLPAAATHPAPAVPVAATLALRGRVTLTAARGPVTAGDFADTLVYFVPASGNVLPHPGAFTVFTQNRAFDPAAMAIPLGSTVTFTNLDEVRHNEFSVTPGSAFNLGYQAPGQKTAQRFARPGMVLVGCHVHRPMELDVLVVPTAFVTRVAPDGSFTLRDLPPGPGTLYVWSPRGRLVTRSVTLPAQGSIAEHVELVRPALSAQIDVRTQP